MLHQEQAIKIGITLFKKTIYIAFVTSFRQDLQNRLEQRKTEEAKHRALIRKRYAESQARHAYRLAHPAYADGRIW